ncbi:von Ebner gland protein 1-like [Mesocricetus auratus]|uniref:von Ebner gland protein 1-like n=1 Tax=Mesocricetus auratus TaxID=10036 RepID=A0ABM2XJK5_MESAU|nr:von Ebner gland protein 1-like [Mesocricetus auratus]XP_040601126.1 von Ebner gland protein 1-like [Mesocricetus auratus]
MKALLLSFGFGLVAVLQAQEFPDTEEIQDVTGTWYIKATASDKEIPEELESVSVTPMTITALEGGNLQVNFTALIVDRCREVSFVLEKTDKPDKYTVDGGTHVLYVMPSAVKDHYIFNWESKNHAFQFRLAKLLGRDPDINQEALEDFRNAARVAGLNAEKIFIPKQSETCSLRGN